MSFGTQCVSCYRRTSTMAHKKQCVQCEIRKMTADREEELIRMKLETDRYYFLQEEKRHKMEARRYADLAYMCDTDLKALDDSKEKEEEQIDIVLPRHLDPIQAPEPTPVHQPPRSFFNLVNSDV